MLCPYCGAENLEGSNFCSACGRSLTSPSPAQPDQQPPAQPNQQPPAQPNQQPPAQPDQRPAAQPDQQPPVQPKWQPARVSKTGTFEGVSFAANGILKWPRDIVERMTPEQLTAMLSEMEISARRRTVLYQKVDQYKTECTELENNVALNRDNFFYFSGLLILEIICFLLSRFLRRNTLLSLIFGFLCFGGFIVAIVYLVGTIRYIIAKKKYNSRYAAAQQDYQRAVRAWIQSECVEHADEFISDSSVLPDYYNNVYAITYMLKALNNHRATTLWRALDQYKRHEDELRIRGQLEQQLQRAKQEAIRKESSAAKAKTAAAQSAAVNSNAAAKNTRKG